MNPLSFTYTQKNGCGSLRGRRSFPADYKSIYKSMRLNFHSGMARIRNMIPDQNQGT